MLDETHNLGAESKKMTVEHISFMDAAAIRLSAPQGDEVTIMLHGAQIVSWKPKGRIERLYLSELADFLPESAIRGGIPICFPQFSNLGTAPFHGFARNMEWQFLECHDLLKEQHAMFVLSETSTTLALWPHPFRAVLHVILAEGSLKVELEITNTGTAEFTFTTALHTYLRVDDITAVRVAGLLEATYFDKVTGRDNQKETRPFVDFYEQTDRIYSSTSSELILHEPEHSLTLRALNMPDTVIWNPWEEKSKTIPDLPDDGYRSMVCLEAGTIVKPVKLSAGKSWRGGQLLKI